MHGTSVKVNKPLEVKWAWDWRIKTQLDATYYFIVLPIGSTCFGHYYAHHQELLDCNVDYHIGRFFL